MFITPFIAQRFTPYCDPSYSPVAQAQAGKFERKPDSTRVLSLSTGNARRLPVLLANKASLGCQTHIRQMGWSSRPALPDATARPAPLGLNARDQSWSHVSSVCKAANIMKRYRRCERNRQLRSSAKPMHYVRASKAPTLRQVGVAACEMPAIEDLRRPIFSTSSPQPPLT